MFLHKAALSNSSTHQRLSLLRLYVGNVGGEGISHPAASFIFMHPWEVIAELLSE